MVGRSISHYDITGKIGEGGSGVVYRARDTRLGRDVAIKILPERIAGDEAAMARFQREAELLASLNHANIAHVYGIEPTESSQALVLELIDGPTLEERMDSGRLPQKEALRIALQVASAVATAHDRGIIHRDLKPGNVMLTAKGDAKVLDFGLAMETRLAPDEARLTSEGVVVGTPAYMSPEQARGEALDRRTDVWSFGCILYELLAGRPAFQGGSIAELFAAICKEDVDLAPIASARPAIRRLVERCLRKDRRERLRDIGDVALEIRDDLAGWSSTEIAVAGSPDEPPPQQRTKWGTIAALLAGAVAATLITVLLRPDPPAQEVAVARVSIPVPRGVRLRARTDTSPPIAISPDGRTVAFVGSDGEGVQRLFVRDFDSPKAEVVSGTEDGEAPLFSPDGRWVAFSKHGLQDLWRVSLADSTLERCLSHTPMRGVVWIADGSFIFGTMGGGLFRLPASGGDLEELTQLAKGEVDHRWPQLLPDGIHVLFSAGLESGAVQARLLDLETGVVAKLPLAGRIARFLAPSHIVYCRDNDLWAVRFDVDAHEIVGKPMRVLSGIHVSELGNPHFAVSASGTLVYEPVRPPEPGRELVWVDRETGESTRLASDRGFEFPRISPDGKRIAVAIHTITANHDVWTKDADPASKASFVRITKGGNNLEPFWSPNGERLAFLRVAERKVYWQELNKAGAVPELLLARRNFMRPDTWVGTERLLFTENTTATGADVFELNVTDGSVRALLTGESNESNGAVSAPGDWLAYVSDETGRSEVYVQGYPEPGLKRLVSLRGGTEPVWSHDGRELFFWSGPALYAAAAPGAPGEPFGAPVKLFEGHYVRGFAHRPNYDVSRDGQRFVMLASGMGITTGRLDVFLNFAAELERQLPAPR